MPPVKARHIFPVLLCLHLFCLASCAPPAARPVYFLSDRHGLSFPVVQDWCMKTGCKTLVLLDQHNDVNADSSIIHSYDWAGQLVDRGLVSEVFWVCQYEATDLELLAKRRWLEDNTRNKSEANARRVMEASHIVDFTGRCQLRLPKPYAVSVDLDLYDAARESPSDGVAESDSVSFIRETCAFLRAERCPLVTVCLSAAYQKSPAPAWNYLEAFMRDSPRTARWLFAGGDFGEREESREDLAAFSRWKNEPELFQRYQCGFYRGAYLWLNAPPAIHELFASKELAASRVTSAADRTTASLLRAMQDKLAAEQLLAPYSSKKGLERLHQTAIKALEAYFSGSPLPPPPESHCAFDDKRSRGIAVRYRTATEDRGCLALYSGLDFSQGDAEAGAGYASQEAARDPRYRWIVPEELDGLFVNISLFSYWEPMEGYDDFIPGLDSLLLMNPQAESEGTRETLLQASIASERGYSKEDFLRRLSVKAGLNTDGYKSPGVTFYKAKTISYTAKAMER